MRRGVVGRSPATGLYGGDPTDQGEVDHLAGEGAAGDTTVGIARGIDGWDGGSMPMV